MFNDASRSFYSTASSVGMMKKAVKGSCCGTVLSTCLQEIEENHKCPDTLEPLTLICNLLFRMFSSGVQMFVMSYCSQSQKATVTRMSSTFRLGLMEIPRLWDSLWGVPLRVRWSVSEGHI